MVRRALRLHLVQEGEGADRGRQGGDQAHVFGQGLRRRSNTMSVFHQATVACGKCGTANDVDLAASVNADRRPDLRTAILDGSFQALKCEKCGTALRLPAHLTYLDTGRGQWIVVDSFAALPNWKDAEAEAQDAYDVTFGPDAPDASREIGE